MNHRMHIRDLLDGYGGLFHDASSIPVEAQSYAQSLMSALKQASSPRQIHVVNELDPIVASWPTIEGPIVIMSLGVALRLGLFLDLLSSYNNYPIPISLTKVPELADLRYDYMTPEEVMAKTFEEVHLGRAFGMPGHEFPPEYTDPTPQTLTPILDSYTDDQAFWSAWQRTMQTATDNYAAYGGLHLRMTVPAFLESTLSVLIEHELTHINGHHHCFLADTTRHIGANPSLQRAALELHADWEAGQSIARAWITDANVRSLRRKMALATFGLQALLQIHDARAPGISLSTDFSRGYALGVLRGSIVSDSIIAALARELPTDTVTQVHDVSNRAFHDVLKTLERLAFDLTKRGELPIPHHFPGITPISSNAERHLWVVQHAGLVVMDEREKLARELIDYGKAHALSAKHTDIALNCIPTATGRYA